MDSVIKSSAAGVDVMLGEPQPLYQEPLFTILWTLAFCIIVTTFLANLTTLLCFAIDPKLRTTQNVYIFNLAFADMLIGFPTMLMCAYTELYFPNMLSYTGCKAYLILAYTLSEQSVIGMVLISYDRHMMVQQGARYSAKQTMRAAIIRCSLSWVFCILSFTPAIVLWDVIQGYTVVAPGICDTDIQYNTYYMIYAKSINIVIPIPMITFYCYKIFMFLWNRRKSTKGIDLQRLIAVDEERKKDKVVKATKSLAVLILAFFICWTPYSVISIILTIDASVVPIVPFFTSIWVVFINSMLNPFIYALTNQRYKRNYKKIWLSPYYAIRGGEGPATHSIPPAPAVPLEGHRCHMPVGTPVWHT